MTRRVTKKRGRRALWDVGAGNGGNINFRNILGEGAQRRPHERPVWGEHGYSYTIAQEFVNYLNARDFEPRFIVGGRNHGKNKFARRAGLS